MLEAARIVGFVLLAAIVYGVAQDQVTARISLEYFTVAHPKRIASQAATWVALAWGIAATWQLGVALGVLLALASRAGARPPRSAASLRRPIAILFVATALGAVTLGGAGWFGAQRGAVGMREPFASKIPVERHARFFAAWGATAGAYATGTFGALGLCIAVWRARGRASQRGNSEPGT